MKKSDVFFTLERLVSERILILDGAMGTMIQKRRLSEEEFRGSLFASHPVPLRGDNDVLCLTQPEVILDIHRAYLEAGADIIETNTFNATAVSQADYTLEAWAGEIARAGAALARKACDEVMAREPGRRCFVAGSIGPTAKSLSIGPDPQDPARRELSFDEMAEAYEVCARGLIEGGADILLVETVYDTLNAKAALWALHRVFSKMGMELPVMISATVSDASGRLLSGQTARAFWHSVRHAEPFSVGLNCSLGAESLLPFVEEIGREADCAISVHPNAGLPNEFGEYDDSPVHMARVLQRFAQRAEGREGYGANIVGGCCGTTPDHIKELARALAGIPPRRYHRSRRGAPAGSRGSVLAGLEPLDINEETIFVNVGERCNVAGSRSFARLIREERYTEALQVAKAQIEAGAQILDVNMDDPLIDSTRAMARFLDYVASEPQVARVPVMLDSSRWETLQEGLKHIQGKGIVNSLSLKDGEAVFLERAAQVHALGGAVLVMAMDEEGQAETFERKIVVCERSYRLLVERAGIPPEDIILDPNIFAIGTGVEAHRTHAVDYLRAVEWIKHHLPGARVSGGVSNLSFAFRGNDTLRAAIHAVFLYHARAVGMDMGIVNPAQLVPYEEIPHELRERIEDLVLNRRPDATERLLEVSSQFLTKETSAATLQEAARTPEARVIHALVSGASDTLADDIEALRLAYPHALDVIEGPLMKGMNRVGTLFGEGKLFLPQVIKSARIMRQAVQLLEPHIEAEKQGGRGSRGKILLATVKGDVHDIGKNIVALILSCNGYDIVDLGVMVTAEQIVEAAIAEKVHAVGLSGLISPSLTEMTNVASLMEAHGLSVPLLIGGATTNPVHTAIRIAPCYSGPVVHVADASLAPGVLDALLSEGKRAEFLASLAQHQEQIRVQYARGNRAAQYFSLEEARKIAAGTVHTLGTPVRPRAPGPAYLVTSVSELVPLVDWAAFLRDWEVKGHYAELQKDALALLEEAAHRGFLGVRCAYGIFPAARQGDDILIYRDESRRNVRAVLHCLRCQQTTGQGEPPLSLADFLYDAASGIPDWIGAFAVNAGQDLARAKRALGAEGDDYRSLLLDTLANRLAEAASELLFRNVRDSFWGFGSTGAGGIRPAPGYPTCPDHRDKALIFSLLDAEARLGLVLTESFMMVPVAAVCGWYFASPAARYFSVGKIAKDQLEDYAHRRGESLHATARWLSAHLSEEARG